MAAFEIAALTFHDTDNQYVKHYALECILAWKSMASESSV